MSNVNKNLLVSVVIPLYNCKQFISNAIESVLKQSYKNIEIIVVNDGSTDNPELVLSSYTDKIILITQLNLGLPAARNKGINVSTGTFLVFLDADDLLPEKAIEIEIKLFNNDIDLGWVYGKTEFFNEHGTLPYTLPEKRLKNQVPPEGCIFPDLIRGNFIAVNAVMVKRIVMDVGLFDESLNTSAFEDWDFWLRVSAQYKVKYTDQVVAQVRVREGSLQSRKLKMSKNCIQVINKIISLYPDLTKPYENILNLKKAISYNNIGLEFYNDKYFAKSIFIFFNSLKYVFFQKRPYKYIILSLLQFIKSALF